MFVLKEGKEEEEPENEASFEEDLLTGEDRNIASSSALIVFFCRLGNEIPKQ